MPISKPRRPLALITGTVIAREPKQRYEDGRPTGDVERYDVTVLQSAHGTPEVRFPLGPDKPRVPDEGERVALVVEIGETREYGANMRVVRYVNDDDLAGVAAFVPVSSSK